MKTLTVEFTDEQFERFFDAMSKLTPEDVEVTDEILTAQLKREASAITYAAEQGQLNPDWMF